MFIRYILQLAQMNTAINHYEKVNTFSQRVEISQIFAYCLVIAQLIIFLAGVQTNYLSLTYRVVMNIFILTAFCVMVLAAVKVSLIDPVDSILLEYRNGDQQKVIALLDHCLYCDTCNSYVKNTSKHCRLCNRCVDKFDHHCKWVNNCIGQGNYSWFFVMIVSALVYKVCFCVSIGLLYGQNNYSLYMGTMVVGWIMLAATLPFGLLLLVLVCFHLHLIRIGMTTFEFIMRKRSADEDKVVVQIKMNKTQQSIVHQNNLDVRPSIFQQRVQTSSSDSKKPSFGKKDESTNNKASKSQFTQNIQTNEKDLKIIYKNHKSLNLLVGQSLLVQNQKDFQYLSLKYNEKKGQSELQRQRSYKSYKQGRR